MIENCCNSDFVEEGIELISKGDQDELLVYFLAFKLHCLKGEVEEGVQMFEQMQSSEHTLQPGLLLEVFNVIANTAMPQLSDDKTG